MTASHSPIDAVIDALIAQGRNPRGNIQNGWSAQCPAHEDRNPSLSISTGNDGRVLLHCHAGCATTDILLAIDMSVTDLFTGPRTNGARQVEDARYRYVDEHGVHLYDVIRYWTDNGKTFRQQAADGAWTTRGIRKVPYRLPQLIEAIQRGDRVFIVEGEKDVHTLERAGHIATTNPGGAGKWHNDYNHHFAGADVVIVADRDDPGRDHAQDIAHRLHGIAADITIVEAAAGKDIADHLAAGHDVEDLLLVDDDNELIDPDLDEFLTTDDPDYDWLVEDLIERHDRIIVTGEEGHGKSTLLRQIAVQLASGIHPFTLEQIPPLRVLYVDCENSARQVRRKMRDLRTAAGDAYRTGHLRLRVLGHAIDLASAAIEADLTARIMAQETDILIIGPLYKLIFDDPIKELPAKAVADTIDRLRLIRGSACLIEAHSPYAEGSGKKRPTRPYGASLWSRWPEFGFHIGGDGTLIHWRGQRDERAWPAVLERSQPWPWAATEPAETEDREWHGPTECAAAIVALLTDLGVEMSVNKITDELRARGNSYRNETVRTAARLARNDGRLGYRVGPRNSDLYRIGNHQEAMNEPF